MDGVDLAALFDSRHQVRAGLFAKAFELYDLVRVRVQMIEVGKIAQIAAVDELVQRLHGEAVDIKPALARKADKALQVLGGTVRIGAAQRLHAADGTDTHLGRRAADGTGRRDFIAALGPDDRDALRDDLVGLDDAKLGLAVLADAEALELADVAEACARDSRALELYRVEHRDRRDG